MGGCSSIRVRDVAPMSAGTQDNKYDALFPERVKAGLVTLGRRLSGALLIAFTALLWVSLLTWSVNDPSLTHQTGNSPGNAAGPLGAILSDLLLQTLRSRRRGVPARPVDMGARTHLQPQGHRLSHQGPLLSGLDLASLRCALDLASRPCLASASRHGRDAWRSRR